MLAEMQEGAEVAGEMGAVSEGRWAQRKEATRATLISAARRLFDEQGFTATTVQQIAAAAEVSERTFFRYFESKEDLLLTDVVAVLEEAASRLAVRPLGEAPLEAILGAVRAAALTTTDGALVALATGLPASFSPNPARLVRVFMDWEDRVAQILVGRFVSEGADPTSADVQLRAGVIARAGVSATRSALRHYRALPRSRRNGLRGLGGLLDAAFAVVAEGCPPPLSTTTRARRARERGGARGGTRSSSRR